MAKPEIATGHQEEGKASSPRQATLAAANSRWWVHLLLMTAVAASALYLIGLASNPNVTLSYDSAEYVGAARDFLETGRFLESTHSQSLGVLLPLGYPALIALVAKVMGNTPHLAALQINLVAGVLLPLLAYLLVWRMTTNMAWSFWAGLAIASHWRLVDIASRPMTDPVYTCLFTALAVLTITQFGRPSPSIMILGGLSGLIVGAMYLFRISAFFLLPGLPVLWAAINGWKKKLAWPRLLLCVLFFLVITIPVVVAVSWRFHEVNGGWSLSPQVSINSRMGNFKAGLDNELWTLDRSGDLIIRSGERQAGEVGIQTLPAKLTAFASNVYFNLLFIKRLLISHEPVPISYWLVLLVLLSAYLLSYGNWPFTFANQLPMQRVNDDGFFSISLDKSRWISLTVTYAPIAALVLFLGTILTIARSTLFITILFILFGCFLVLWKPSRKDEVHVYQQGPYLLLGVLVTGAFTIFNIIAYSFLNSQERYMAQTLPIAYACVLSLLHHVFAGSNHLSTFARCLACSGGEDALKTPVELLRRRILGSLAVILVIFLISEVVLLQAKHTLTMAKKRGEISSQSPSSLQNVGEYIRRLAEKRGEPVRVVQDDSGIAYYARGQGYIVPYLETRPDRLLSFLRRHQINFVSSQPFTAFGDVYTGIGLYHLLSALTSAGCPGVINHGNGLFFQINYPPFLRLIAEDTSFPEQGLTLGSEGYHLLWLTLHHESPFPGKRYKNLNTLPTEVLELRRDGEVAAVAANTLCPAPAPISISHGPAGSKVQHPGVDLAYYQVVKQPDSKGNADRPWRLALSPKLPKEFKPGGYAIYTIIPEVPKSDK